MSTTGEAGRASRKPVVEVCDCPGSPCEHRPAREPLKMLPDFVRRPLTMGYAEEMDAAGMHGCADVCRKYAKDRPRWWQRLTNPRVSKEGQ